MGKTLVTGGTGLVGHNLVKALLAQHRSVRALVRNVDRAQASLPLACEPVQGDLTDPASLLRAMEGCSVVYHAAGLPEQWVADRDVFYRVNEKGTRNMVEAALKSGVQKFIYTSTIDVFKAGTGETFNEDNLDLLQKPTLYERSKQNADRIVAEAAGLGLHVVILHPSAVYGPGPSGSRGLNDFFADYATGRLPVLPSGGLPLVFAPDVAAGQLLAEEKAATGARYILSESYYDIPSLAALVGAAAGVKRKPPTVPGALGSLVALVGEAVSDVTRRPPLVAKGQLDFLQWQARPDSSRARRELGWDPVPFAEGLRRTVAFLREHGRLPAPPTFTIGV
jgi:dihydroflavonol-4-reductase